jgi:hypothetical protein
LGERKAVLSERQLLLDKYYLVRPTVFFVCFFLYWYFGQKSVDLDNYEEAYLKAWYQFEPVYNFFMWQFKVLGFSFNALWIFMGVLISLLMAIIYSHRILIIFAIPNICYLMMTTFSTQLRFALGCLVFVYLFQRQSRFLLFLSPLFHFSMIIPIGIKALFSLVTPYNNSFFSGKGFFVFIALVLGLLAGVNFLNALLANLGYGHYVDSKYLVQKSTSSVIYMVVSIVIAAFSLSKSYGGRYRASVYFAIGLLVCSLVFSSSAIISGRMLKLYFLFEPFILMHFYVVLRKNVLGWVCIFVVFVIQITKFGAVV